MRSGWGVGVGTGSGSCSSDVDMPVWVCLTAWSAEEQARDRFSVSGQMLGHPPRELPVSASFATAWGDPHVPLLVVSGAA